MLLVTQEDMFQKWALARQESRCNLKTLSVPVLRFNLPLFLDFRLQVFTSRVQQETHLSRHTEVANCQYTKFL